MEIIGSEIDVCSDDFQKNCEYHLGLRSNLAERLNSTLVGGGENSIKKHYSRNKFLARERINKIIDNGSEFLELSQLAADGVYEFDVPSAGVVTGIGRIQGILCMFVANDATVKGGTYFPLTVKKHLRAQEIALNNNLPCIYLVDSGGAFLPKQSEVFPDRDLSLIHI